MILKIESFWKSGLQIWQVIKLKSRFHKKVRKQDVAVVLCTMLGIALFFIDQLAPGYVLGNLVGIASGMFMAGMFVTVGEIEPAERFSGVLNGQILTFLVGLPFFLATKPA